MAMRKTIAGVLLLIVIVGVFAVSKPKLAVYGFDSTSFSQEEIAGLTSLLESQLFDLGYFSIVERASLEKILKEKKLESGGIVGSTKRAMELGRLVGADYIAFGKIDRALNNIVLSFKIVDVNTGEVVFSVSKMLGYGSPLEKLIENMVKTIKVDEKGRIMKEKMTEEAGGLDPVTTRVPSFTSRVPGRETYSKFFLSAGIYTIPDEYNEPICIPVLKMGLAEYRKGDLTGIMGASLPTLGAFYRTYFGMFYGEIGTILIFIPYVEVGVSFSGIDIGLFWFYVPYVGVSFKFWNSFHSCHE